MTHKHQVKKHLGQNFLTCQRTLQKIVDACSFQSDDTVVEIGPGQGVLTRLIAPKVKQLICIEADRDLIEPLRAEFEGSNVEIIHADFLKWNMDNLKGIKIIGNIPYYISTPIIEKIIESRSRILSGHLTVQLEFGQRLVTSAGSKEYGSLTCFAQYYFDVALLFKIKSASFNPKPKVDSCFVSLNLHQAPRYHPKDEAFMFKMIRQAFTQRRKTLLNALSTTIDKERLLPILTDLQIDPKLRPESLTLNDYVRITNRAVI